MSNQYKTRETTVLRIPLVALLPEETSALRKRFQEQGITIAGVYGIFQGVSGYPLSADGLELVLDGAENLGVRDIIPDARVYKTVKIPKGRIWKSLVGRV